MTATPPIEFRWLQHWVDTAPGESRLVGKKLQYRQLVDLGARDIWSEWQTVPEVHE